jgi:D-serine deaminase-like pyridoxal phosphate-dependent protein
MINSSDITNEWYPVKNIDKIDSPALIIFPQRVVENISLLKTMIDDVERLRPHVKTHKTKEAASLMMQAGINKFKCATIAEAEMLGMVNAPDVLLAYQPVGPKLQRFDELIKKYPSTKFSCLVDSVASAENIAKTAIENNIIIPVFIDLNVGMNRTGISPGDQAVTLYECCSNLKGIHLQGLHVYDGHIRSRDIQQRTTECNNAFEPVEKMRRRLADKGFQPLVIIAGGSPTFPIHAQRKDVECSPGTFIFWDKGYSEACPEQHFVFAALVISRIVSLPDATKICLDLGHKSIASENELPNRVYFLNAPTLKFISHSEEHLIADAGEGHSFKIGDVVYGLPFHICPTVALYERTSIVENNEVIGEWKIIARDKKIGI